MGELNSSTAPWRRAELVHRLPAARVVDRAQRLVELARGRRVVDLGFVDAGLMQSKLHRGIWLHQRLAEVARELVGIDHDGDGVRAAQSLGFEAYLADCQSLESLSSLGLDAADLVVAGELIEHLDRPGSFLEAIRCLVRPDGLLALTTPNASRLINFIAALLGREVVNADHVGWQTWRTMRTLLERHNWELREFSYYANPALVRSERSRTESLKIGTINAFRFGARILFKLRPSLADGMIAVAVPRSAI